MELNIEEMKQRLHMAESVALPKDMLLALISRLEAAEMEVKRLNNVCEVHFQIPFRETGIYLKARLEAAEAVCEAVRLFNSNSGIAKQMILDEAFLFWCKVKGEI